MVSAKSASGRVALGASLVAILVANGAHAAIHGSGVTAIHGSGIEAIHGSGIEAIHGSGTEAIHGSGIEAIHGSGIDAIHGSGIDAIHGSGIDAIHGSGIDAIHGSGIDAIHGSGIDAIHGSGIDAIHGSGIDAIHGSGVVASNFLLIGPVHSIDWGQQTFVSLGQNVSFAGLSVDGLQVGAYVKVSGQLAGVSQIVADGIFVSSQPYAAGSDIVMVTGVPTSVNYNYGVAKIGSLVLDYTPALGGEFDGFGAAVTAIGTQPILGGVMTTNQVIDKTDLFLR